MTNVDSLTKRSKKFAIQNNMINPSGSTRTLSRLSSIPTIQRNTSIKTDLLGPEIYDHHQNHQIESNHLEDPLLYEFEENIDVTSEDIPPSHVNNDNFDPDPPNPLLDSTPVQTTIPNSVNAHLCSNKKVQITPLLMYQIHLQYTLNQEHHLKLSLQDKINEIIVIHSKKGLDLSNVKCYSKDHLIQTVAKLYNLHHLKPQMI